MKGSSAQYLSLPFSEAINFFRQKVSLPTKSWDDLWKGMHSRAFVVAGASKADLLLDIRSAVDKAISQGTTLADFRKDFDAIVDRYGWNYKGGRNWRSATIYDTNLSVAYAAGHHKAMTDPAVLSVRPYWRYLPSSAAHPRQEHQRWYNLVLPHDDPFWQTHRPPNGWGCHCGLASVSTRELERLLKEEESGLHPIRTQAPEADTYDYINKKTGETSQVPVGIDPGWDYNPGEAAWGRWLSDKMMAEYREMKGAVWQKLTPGNWETYGLPQQLQPHVGSSQLYPATSNTDEALERLRTVLGGEEQIYNFTADGYSYAVLVNAKSIVEHIGDNLAERSPYFGFIPETIMNPQEVWMSFEKHRGTGQVVLRQRIIRMVEIDKKRLMCVVVNARNGMLEAWTFFPRSKMGSVKKLREGQLVWKE